MTKAERTQQLKRRYTVAIGIVAASITIGTLTISAHTMDCKMESVAKKNETKIESKYEEDFKAFYAIYDVVSQEINNDELTELTVDINGEFHIFAIEDAPEDTEIRSVCLEINSDDVTTWKVVAVK